MKTIDIIPYKSKYRSQWESFVKKSNNGTIFQLQKFLHYHPRGRFKNKSILFLEDNKIIAVMPATIVLDGKSSVLSSHSGASFGGIITKSGGLSKATLIVESLVKYAKKEHINKIRLTPTPLIYLERPSQEIEFALYKNRFVFKKRELTSVLKLSRKTDILELFKAESRTAMRKAIKSSVVIKDTSQYEDFYQLLKTNLNNRYKLDPVHSLNELTKLVHLFPRNISLKAAYRNKKMIAGVVNFKCNDRVVLAFYISQDYEFQELRPLNLLFYEILKDLIKMRYNYYDLGLYTVNMEPNWGLGRFKESLGGTGVFRDYYELSI